MALDTKYRPIKFDDVIGQDSSVKVLRQFVRTGTGFHQSYVFCGFHGSGKTTMGRIDRFLHFINFKFVFNETCFGKPGDKLFISFIFWQEFINEGILFTYNQ